MQRCKGRVGWLSLRLASGTQHLLSMGDYITSNKRWKLWWSPGHHVTEQCSDCEDDLGSSVCGWVLTSLSFLMVVITLPFSLCVCFKVGLSTEDPIVDCFWCCAAAALQ